MYAAILFSWNNFEMVGLKSSSKHKMQPEVKSISLKRLFQDGNYAETNAKTSSSDNERDNKATQDNGCLSKSSVFIQAVSDYFFLHSVNQQMNATDANKETEKRLLLTAQQSTAPVDHCHHWASTHPTPPENKARHQMATEHL